MNKSALDIFTENLGNVLRGNNKLNVVFASVVVILVGIVIYLIYNENRIGKLEKKLKDKE